MELKNPVRVLLTIFCLLMCSCAVPTPSYTSWEGEAQFYIADAYSKGGDLQLPGRKNGYDSDEQLIIKIDTETQEIQAVEGNWEKNKRKIYSEDNGFVWVRKFPDRPHAIDFDFLEETKGDLTKAIDFEKMDNEAYTRKLLDDYEKWVILPMRSLDGSRKTRFTLYSREPEFDGKHTQEYEIDLGTVEVRKYKKIVLFDPFGGFGMD